MRSYFLLSDFGIEPGDELHAADVIRGAHFAREKFADGVVATGHPKDVGDGALLYAGAESEIQLKSFESGHGGLLKKRSGRFF